MSDNGTDPHDERVDVSVLIVAYHCRDMLGPCLDSIEAQTACSHEVIVVDNHSDDGTVELLSSEYPWVKTIANTDNVGFARAVNQGARVARGEHLLLLNPDTVVLDGAIDELVRFAREHPAEGIYGGRTLAPDGSVDPKSCWGAPTPWSLLCFATGLRTIFPRSPLFDPESLGRWERDSVRHVDIVTGCLLLARRDVWDELDGLDERFFVYGEDADFCLRAAKAGYRPIIDPRASITHYVGGSSSRGPMLVLLMSGNVTLLHEHWSDHWRRYGTVMFATGVGIRGAAGWAKCTLRRLRGGATDAESDWLYAWRHRATWLDGFPRRDDARADTSTSRARSEPSTEPRA